MALLDTAKGRLRVGPAANDSAAVGRSLRNRGCTTELPPVPVANAVFHATGVRVRDLPIRLESLL